MKWRFLLLLCLGNLVVTGANDARQSTLNPLSHQVTLGGRVVDQSGAGIEGVQLTAYLSGSSTFRDVISGTKGAFAIPVFNGTWFVDVTANLPENMIWPKHVFEITGTNISNIEYKLLTTDANISGAVKTWTGQAVSNVQIWARANIDGYFYSAPLRSSNESGEFSVSLLQRGSWALGLDCSQLVQTGYLCASAEAVEISEGAGHVDFIVVPRVTRSPRIANPRRNGPVTFSFTLQGDSGKYIIQGGPTPASFGPVSEAIIPPGQSSMEISVDSGFHFFRAMGASE